MAAVIKSVTFDCADALVLARFWAAALGQVSVHDLNDAERAQLEPLLRHPWQGHRWNDHRLVIDGVFHRVGGGRPKLNESEDFAASLADPEPEVS